MSQASKKALDLRCMELRAADPGGLLRPAALVESASDPEDPLHSEFTWDDGVCGTKWRIEEARRLIRSVTYVEKAAPVPMRPIPKYVSSPVKDNRGAAYMSVDTLKTDTVIARRAIDAEFARIECAVGRARALAGEFGLEKELDEMLTLCLAVRKHIAA